jgi:hypothetical protein
MKKVLLLVTGLFLSVFQSKAQYISLGPVAGFGHSWVSNLTGTDRFKASPYLGIGMVYSKDVHWGWGGELAVSHEGYKADMGMNTVTVNPVYLRLPLRAYYFFGPYKSHIRPKVYLGPSFGFKVDEVQYMNGNRLSNSDVIATTYNMHSDMFNSFDVGLNTGAGVNVRLMPGTWLNMDLGYNLGFLDAVDNTANTNNMNQNIRLNVGVLFGLK